MSILLAIPCYNCEDQIDRVIESLKSVKNLAIDEIVFINNCSTDNTEKKIIASTASLNIPASLFNNKNNYGLGGSFKLVYEYANQNNFEHLAFFHGDDQAKVVDLKDMVNEIRTLPNLTALLGSRFDSRSMRHGYSLVRTLGNNLLNLIFSILCLRKISEIGSGLNIYRVDKLKSLNVDLWPNHIAFDVNLILGFIREGLDFKFHPIQWIEQDQKSNAGNFSTAILVLFMLLKWRLGFENKSLEWKRDFNYDKIIL